MAGAQTVFPRPDTTPNYAGYRYLEECQAAIDRLSDAAERAEGVWKDTARFDPTEKYRPHPSSAVTAGQACLSNLKVDTLHIDPLTWQTWSGILTVVGREADVRTLYDRIKAQQLDLDTLLHLSRLASVYREARPIRLSEAREVWEQLVKAEPVDTFNPHLATQVGWALFWDLWNTGDTAAARQVGLRALASFEQQIAVGRRTDMRPYPEYFLALYDQLSEREWQDSLTRSTEAYRRFMAYRAQRFLGDSLLYAGATYLARTAPEIKGNAEFRSVASGAAASPTTLGQYVRLSESQYIRRPVPGRVNLVAFLQGGCHSLTKRVSPTLSRWNFYTCMQQISALRRLKQRFPAVELTIVTNTFGSVGNAPPLANPSDEADTLAKLFLGFHHIPGTLVVSYSDFWRVPGLDNRRIDEEYENIQRWEEATGRGLVPPFVVAVDETGAVFHKGILGGLDFYKRKDNDELILEKKLEAVFRRVQSSQAEPGATHTVALPPDPTSPPEPLGTVQKPRQ